MAIIKTLTDRVCVAPQIRPDELAALKEQGFTLVINNRPDGEEPGQPTSKEIHEAASAAGLDYAHIPVERGISPAEVDAMRKALGRCGTGKVLSFCRSGTRSTMLWALAQAEEGVPVDELHAKAEEAGYSLAPISHLL